MTSNAQASHSVEPTMRPFRLSWPFLLAGLLGGLASAAGIALTATSGWLIVRASEQPPILTLMTAIVGVRAFGMARVVFRYAERLRSHDAALADLAEARAWTYSRLVPLTPARLGRRRRADVLSGVVDDLTDVNEAAVRVTVPVISTVVAGALALALTTWALPVAGAVVAAMLLGCAVLVLVAGRLENAGQQQLLAARAEVAAVASLVSDQADQLRAIGATAEASGWVDDAHCRLRSVTLRQARGRAMVTWGLLVLSGLAAAVAAMLVVDADLHPGLQALLVLTPIALGDAVGVLTDATRAQARARASARRVSALLDQDPAVVDTSPERRHSADPGAGVPAIELRGVSAGWTDDAVHLAPLDLDLPPGVKLAVTGPNGAGKSTLLAVLARHLDPLTGTMSLDGIDVRALPLDVVRGLIAVVDDEPHIFATTLRENLRLAMHGAVAGETELESASDAQVDAWMVDALRRAGLAEWFAALPEGLDTRLGAGGRGVSGGERARLAVARALLSRRPVLLLDEPVAHLDQPTARAVLEDLVGAANDRTIVMVTHHTTGLDLFDRRLELARPEYSVV